MTRSEFFRAVDDEFGPIQGRSLLRDLVVGELEDRTATTALMDGVSPKVVWFALCAAMQVPTHRWHGAGLPTPTSETVGPDTPA